MKPAFFNFDNSYYSVLFARDGHPLDKDGTTLLRTAHQDIITHCNNVTEHVEEIAGDGHLFNSMLNLATLNPKTGCAPRIITGYRIYALPQQFSNKKTAVHFL